ncbi:transcription factor bHLH144-like [Magnolia sinica]|uniref:transcription factor bHLH144-like n=1 Tax=Magnolia sinica TaxID=86752 RepID=UPI0026593F08|nr:transcription factor bHLH144-like [Magnolia sinica]XP_058101131.1 transcription factor bHLH144-like [Magnolia sinica]XP_058101132.1 transcription factor bHLH144-like [Magnolia sinica]XP_058101133.1 transcription factor bHLH144-like [Magnolia sinica]XP_058101134.1 transcription factor bHLH144-like [Magnolia sinica]
MQSDQKFYPRKVVPPPTSEVDGYTYNIPVAPSLDPTLVTGKPVGPFHGVEIQASEMCPKNFIIFDQTDNKSRIMFHPAMASKFHYPGFDIHATYTQENVGGKDEEDNESILKEDTKDIDALMSLEEDEDEDEEVSTGRTMGDCRSSSPDSDSTNSTNSHNTRLSSLQKQFSCNASSCSTSSKRKQQRMKKMMKALRGIVPGGNRMDTATVLDEAVRYLKSLKVEVKKLGIGNFKKN